MDRADLTKLAQAIAGKTFPTDDTVPVRADALAELLRVYRAVEEAPVTEVCRQAGPFNKPLSEVDWPDFQITYVRAIECDKDGRLVREGEQEKGDG